MIKELRYVVAEEKHERMPNGMTRFSPRVSPIGTFGHFQHEYRKTRGKNRRQIVEWFSQGFKVDADLGERMLRDEVPRKAEDDGSLTFKVEVPDPEPAPDENEVFTLSSR